MQQRQQRQQRKRKYDSVNILKSSSGVQPPQPPVSFALEGVQQQQQHQQQLEQSFTCRRKAAKQHVSPDEPVELKIEPKLYQAGKITVMAGKGVIQADLMTDSTSAVTAQNWDFLRDRLKMDGYLFLRNVLSSSKVLKARNHLLRELHDSRPECFAPDSPAIEGRLAQGASGLGLLARQDLAATPLVSAVLEAPELFALMRGLFEDTDIITSGYKWLRAVASSEFTGLHTDRVFLGRGTSRLLTAWLPLGAISPSLGSLLVAAGSHRLDPFAGVRSTYGMSQVGSDGTRSGWLSDNGAALSAACGGMEVDWRVADCRPGDIVVLGLDVLHMSTSNESIPASIRLSCDTRWQPNVEQKDPRLKVWQGDASSYLKDSIALQK